MESSSQSKPSEDLYRSETGKPNLYQNDDNDYLEPYEPNNTDYNDAEESEILHELSDTSQGFEEITPPPTKDNPLAYIDHALPPAKYANMTEFTQEFWKERKQKMEDLKESDMLKKTKNMSVPMARVKKIMRIDEDVRNLMIASDAPIFMAQAAEFFIEEMTGMGWQFVSESRRRILQRNDLGVAVKKNDQFDFLIDFLPPPVAPNPPPMPSMFQGMNSNVERKPYFHVRNTPPLLHEKKLKSESLMLSDNGQSQILRRNFEERKRRQTPPHRVAFDQFKCVLNETPSGNEYQITAIQGTTTSTPSTSNFQVPTSSASASEEVDVQPTTSSEL